MATATTLPLPTMREASNGTHDTSSIPDQAAGAPTATVWEITPARARELLERGHRNRPVSYRRVRSIAQAIGSGRFVLNGETIVLDVTGRVIDGKHRLLACVLANLPITSFVVEGIPAAVFPSLDQGQRRSGGDVLFIEGHAHGQQLSSAARWLWRFENECMYSSVINLLNAELPQYLTAHPKLSLALSWGALTRALVPQGLGSALFHLMSQKDQALSKQFFTDLARGENLTAGEPAYHIREQFLKYKGPLYHKNVVERAAVCILAWNHLRRRVPVTPRSLGWQAGKGPAVHFPAVV